MHVERTKTAHQHQNIDQNINIEHPSYVCAQLTLLSNKVSQQFSRIRERLSQTFATCMNYIVLHSIQTYEPSSIVLPNENRVTLLTEDRKASLHGFQYHSQPNTPVDEQKWIVYFLPNGARWEDMIKELQTLADRCQASILCYNYRGIHPTKLAHDELARSEDDFYADGHLIVDNLLNRGVLKEHILLYGYSFGGAIATRVAADKELALCSERSFSSLRDTICTLVPSYPSWGDTLCMLVPRLICYLAGTVFSQIGWGFDTTPSIQKLAKQVVIMSNPKDTLIRPHAQFGTWFDKIATDAQKRNAACIQLHTEEHQNAHCEPLSVDEFNQCVRYVHRILNRVRL